MTRTEKLIVGKTQIYRGELTELVRQIKPKRGKGINCDGGAEIINELLKQDLIDEFIISVIPILVGNGTRLCNKNRPKQHLEFKREKSFESGLTQLRYLRKR